MRMQATPALAASLAVVTLLAAPAGAQSALEVSFSPAYESFTSEVSRPDDPALAGAIDFEHRFDRLRLWYALDAATYADEGEWGSLKHGLGATLRLGQQDGTRFFVGASAALRRNGSSWSDANYDGLGAFANAEAQPWSGLTIRSGYRFDARTFDELPSLDQREHDGFLSLRANLPSRTTLIGELHVGRKDYEGDPVSPVYAGTAIDHTAQQAQAGAGRGQGQGQQMASRPPVVPPATGTAGGPAQANQVSWLLRAAQSLADRTGLSFQYTQRVSSGDVPPALVSTPALFFDDGVYDDPFASDALAFRGALKQSFASGAWIEATGSWSRRDYRGQPALDASGLPLPDGSMRTDRVSQGGLLAAVPVFAARAGAWTLELQPSWRFTSSSSNDAYYDYTSHALALGVSLSY